MPSLNWFSRGILLISTVLASRLAQAHTGVDAGQHHDALMQGLLHPLGGIDHISAAIAVGVWGALFCRRAVTAPAVFVLSMALGAVLGGSGLAIEGVETVIASSVLVLGGLLVAGRFVPASWALAALASFAAAHGLAHGHELANTPNAALALLGLMLTTAALHGVGMALAKHLLTQRVWLQRSIGLGLGVLGSALLLMTAGGLA